MPPYSRFIEIYLLACNDVPGIEVIVSGQGGETAGGFSGRCESSLNWFNPTVGTLCHGMNEALRGSLDTKSLGDEYTRALRKTLAAWKSNGVRVALVGGPGIIDPDTASAGHTVVKSEGGAVDLQSARWPFVLSHKQSDLDRLRTMAKYCSFIEDLDRLVLVVPDCPWPSARVTWGAESHVFMKEQLAAGINLMAYFFATPFDMDFEVLGKAVAAKQVVEQKIRENLSLFKKNSEEGSVLFEKLKSERSEALVTVKAALKPVNHRILVAKAE